MESLTGSQRLMMYLYGGKNIAGCALAMVGLALFFGGVIDVYWWAIVAGLYGAGALGWPRNALVEQVEQAQLSAEELAQQVRRLVEGVARGLPKEAIEVLHSIESTLQELLPRLKEMQDRGIISAKDSFTVIETVRRYLPDTLGAYLRLPKLYAQVQVLADGRTASRTFLDQLHVLDSSLKEVAKNAFAGDAEKLIVNGRFLQTKFAPKAVFTP
jgi:hypothetical protein